MPADSQYRTHRNLCHRIALHDKYGGGGRLASIHDEVEIRAGDRILEVGCGTGRFWRQGATSLPDDLEITLTDRSPAMVDQATALLSSIGKWKHARVITASVEELPFEDCAFDYAIAMHMLYHAADPKAALRELGRVLRPGGRLLVTTNGLDNLKTVFELRAEAFGAPSCDLGAARFGLEKAPSAIGEMFTLLKAETFREIIVITDPEDVVGYLLSALPDRRADDGKEKRLREVVKSAFRASRDGLETERVTGFILAQR